MKSRSIFPEMESIRSVRAASAWRALCAGAALGVCASTAWAEAGYVHEISGRVLTAAETGSAAPARVGATFDSGTEFRTGTNGKAILKFADGQVVALNSDSELRVGSYRYVANNVTQSTTALELRQGELRYVAGQIGRTHREGVRLTAGNSTVSIQRAGGADFVVFVTPRPQEVGAAVVAAGEISVRTPYGPIGRVDAGQYAPWQPGRTPLPLPLAAAPAVVQAGTASLWESVLPASAPVAVVPAARAAVVAAADTLPQAAPNIDPAQAGYVDAVSSTVTMRKTSGGTAAVNVGDVFQAGASFDTGRDGQVVLKFADGQIVVLGPSSVLDVDRYQFDPRNARGSQSAVDLLTGSMRYVTGVIHTNNPDGLKITAGASAVTALNAGYTDFTVVVDTKDKEVGLAAVTAGEVSVRTPYGTTGRIASGQAAPWQPGETPRPAGIAAGASGATGQEIASLAATPIPDNAPVSVAASARAAAALAAANQAQAATSVDPTNARLRASAQTAQDLANSAAQAATAASQAVAATELAVTLASLPPTGAGTVASLPPPAAGPAAPTLPATGLPTSIATSAVTPGAGGGCLGSKC